MQMIVMPAVDILDHNVVQLVGGVRGTEQLVLPDPVQVARDWVGKGAPKLHVVDLDGAFAKGNNIPVIRRIIKECGVPVEVGGGIRSIELAEYLLDAGAAQVVVGTKAIREPEWLARLAERNPEKIVLALDVRQGMITVKGWQESAGISHQEMFRRIRDIPLAAVLHTDVDVEGKVQGIDVDEVESFVSACPHRVIASGGITGRDDLAELERIGIRSAVVGLALYTGKLNPTDVWRL
jgi:phosphoribosylformimino-5-aminoimidazole carboxamide ribotide isomerase